MSVAAADRVYSFHLVDSSIINTFKALWSPPSSLNVPGLCFAECMTVMELGAPIVSPARMQMHRLAMFAAWENESAIDNFFLDAKAGQRFARGWHVRMDFLRRWGNVSEIGELPETAGAVNAEDPVIAVTLARMKLPQVPRFIHWGKPVEKLVRDHPGQTLALAAMRLPRTVSTFTIWKSQQEMLDMVAGHSKVPAPERHAVAMGERNRKDFHFEFTTLRFKLRSEQGSWQGRENIVPI